MSSKLPKEILDQIPVVGGPNAEIVETRFSDTLSSVMGDKNNILDSNRPYAGQPWTNNGARGKVRIQNITFRDLADCLLRAIILSEGSLTDKLWAAQAENQPFPQESIYEVDLGKIDAIALCQNLTCEVEKAMGIFPNIHGRDALDYRKAYWELQHEIQQVIGKALGYPRYADDPKNCPDAVGSDEVCTGEHVAETLVLELVHRYETLKDKNRNEIS